MASAANRSKVSRHWGPVAVAGGLGFAVGAGGLALLGRDWLVHALAQASAPVAALATGAMLACVAMSLAAVLTILRVRTQYRLIRSALNTMTQGLCMFDSTARLVLCNERYIEMYGLRSGQVQRNTPLRQLLVDRKLRRAMDSFSGMPLTRPPKGFPKDHPAMDLLLCRQWGVEAKLAPSAALEKNFAGEVIRHLRLATPLVEALNTPLLAGIQQKRRPLFGFQQLRKQG